MRQDNAGIVVSFLGGSLQGQTAELASLLLERIANEHGGRVSLTREPNSTSAEVNQFRLSITEAAAGQDLLGGLAEEIRTGLSLISSVSGSKSHPAGREEAVLGQEYKALMLDIDGVLREFGAAAKPEEYFIKKIAFYAAAGIPVAINSTRKLSSVDSVLTDSLRKYVPEESKGYIYIYFVQEGKIYLTNLAGKLKVYVGEKPRFTEEQTARLRPIIEKFVSSQDIFAVKKIDEKTDLTGFTIKFTEEDLIGKVFKEPATLDNFVLLLRGALTAEGIDFAQAVNSGIYCNVIPTGKDIKIIAAEHFIRYLNISPKEAVGIADQAHSLGFDYQFMRFVTGLSTEKADTSDILTIEPKNCAAAKWYMERLKFKSPYSQEVRVIQEAAGRYMAATASLSLAGLKPASAEYAQASNFMASRYPANLIAGIMERLGALETLLAQPGTGRANLLTLVRRIDNTLANPERILWFLDYLIERISKKGLNLEQALADAQSKLFIGPQEMWIYLAPILAILDKETVVFVARNEELRNAWHDLVAIAAGVGRVADNKDYLVKLSRHDAFGPQLNAVLTDAELMASIAYLWERLDAACLAQERAAIEAGLKKQGLAFADLKQMTRGKAVEVLADIGIDENITRYWNLYRDINSLRDNYANATEPEVLGRYLGQLKELIPQLSGHLQALAATYDIDLGRAAAEIKIMLGDFNMAVNAPTPDKGTISELAKNIYAIWLRNVNYTFAVVDPSRIVHTARPLLNILLEDTGFRKDLRNGAIFVDDIIAGGRTLILSRLFSQAFVGGISSQFIPVLKRNKFPEGTYYYVTQLARIPEDCPDVCTEVYYAVKDINGIRVLKPAMIEDILGGHSQEIAPAQMRQFEAFVDSEVAFIRAGMPGITLNNQILRQVVRNCLNGVPEKDTRSIYGLLIENYYNPAPTRFKERKHYRYQIGEVFKFYSQRVAAFSEGGQGREMIVLARAIRPYEEAMTAAEWKDWADIYRAKQVEAISKAGVSVPVRSLLERLFSGHRGFRNAVLEMALEIRETEQDIPAVAQSSKFRELVRLQREISLTLHSLLGEARDNFALLDTRFSNKPDVRVEDVYAGSGDIALIKQIFGIVLEEDLDRDSLEELIRYYNEAIALMRVYIEQSGDVSLRKVSEGLSRLLIAPRINSGSKSHPAGKAELEKEGLSEADIRETANRIIEAPQVIEAPFTRKNLDELCAYYIPLAAEIISRQRQLGRRYVVAISGLGGIGKSIFSERLQFVMNIMLGEGKVGLIHQDEYFYDLEPYPDGNPYSSTTVAQIKEELRVRGEKRIPASDGSGRFLDAPYILEQIASFRRTGKCYQPQTLRKKEVREGAEKSIRKRVALNEVQAEQILIAEGLYFLVGDLYNTKFAPDDEWAALYRKIFSESDLRLYLDADLAVVKNWRLKRGSDRRGRGDAEMEERWQRKYKLHAVKAAEDINNADVVIRKGQDHAIIGISWDEQYEKERILHSFGVATELEEGTGTSDIMKLIEADRLNDPRNNGSVSLVLLTGG
ncbi:MAG: hypothetical protein NT033_06970, partial [Candidatus Omnitrophica bacterium]|nr:hypothetical protein [Candidatus Omnitrophota bacterium]